MGYSERFRYLGNNIWEAKFASGKQKKGPIRRFYTRKRFIKRVLQFVAKRYVVEKMQGDNCKKRNNSSSGNMTDLAKTLPKVAMKGGLFTGSCVQV